MSDEKPSARPLTAEPQGILPVELREVVYAPAGKALLDGLSFRLGPGRRTVIMGANGAGKSLTLRLIQGLIAPDRGTVHWSAAPGRHDVALVFQRPVLLRRSVAANLRHSLRVYGLNGKARAQRVDELLEIGGLVPLRDRPARVLSAGEQQRLALVRALGRHPRLLLLDEPTANLDPASTQAIEALVNRAHEDGTKIVFVTHDIGQASRLADDIVFMHAGKAVETGAAEAFFSKPRSAAGRAYLAGRLYTQQEETS